MVYRKIYFTCLFFISFQAYSQLDTTFWFVAPEVAQNHGDRPIVFRFATLSNPAVITITQPANPAFPVQVLNLGANTAQTLDLTPWIDITENKPANTILNFGFKITATSQITAYYEVTPTCNCNPDIFALKGKNALGTSFLTPFQNFLNNASYARSGFNIVATENNTTVTIVPTQNIVGHVAGVPFTITLNQGQTYFAEASSTAANLHLGGSSVVSNKKIAITLHDDTAEGTPYGGCADLQGDQLIPISILGMEYLAIKGYLNGPDKVYILGTSNGTQISIDGVNVGNINLGQTYVHTLSNPTAYIVATDSVCVLHQSGFGCEVGEAILPPLLCTGSNVVPFTRSTNEFFALNILSPASGISNFTYNGNAGIITAANFNPVPGTGNAWYYAQMDLSSIVAVQQASRVENNSVKFHLGLIHGGSSSGCRYGYFSDFASLRYEIQSSNETYCEGETINLNTNTLPGATYNWTGPNNFSEVGSTVTISNAQIADSGVYIVSGQLPDACILLPDTIQISIITQPEMPIINNDGPWCLGESGIVWHTIPSMFSYTWTDNLGNPLANNDTLFFNELGSTGNISVNLVANLNNCFSEIASQTIEVFGLPTISITNPDEVCGDNITLTSSSINFNGDSIDSIIWMRLNTSDTLGIGATLADISSSSAISNQDIYTVMAISENGCTSSDTMNFTFHALPEISIGYEDLCNGQSVLFTATNGWIGSPLIGETYSTSVNFGDGNYVNNTPEIFIHSYTNPGEYSVNITATSSNGCIDSTSALVVLQAIPTANPIVNGECGQQGIFTANLITSNFEVQSASWTIPGVGNSNQVDFSQIFASGGNYNATLSVTGTNNCVFDFPIQFYIKPSVELPDLEIPNVITANGDGINDKIELDPLFDNCFSYKITFLNRWGVEVFKMSSSANAFEGKDTNGDDLAAGVYFYVIESDQGIKHGFITIVR
jgi:gliding motility-associated-like protein